MNSKRYFALQKYKKTQKTQKIPSKKNKILQSGHIFVPLHRFLICGE